MLQNKPTKMAEIKGNFYYCASLMSSLLAAAALGWVLLQTFGAKYYRPLNVYAVISMVLPIISGLLFLFCDKKRVYMFFMLALFIGLHFFLYSKGQHGRDVWEYIILIARSNSLLLDIVFFRANASSQS